MPVFFGGQGRPSLHQLYAPWHFLYFLPEPQGEGVLRPTFSAPRTTCCTVLCSLLPAMRACSSSRRFLRWKASSSSSTEVATCRGGLPLPPPPDRSTGTPASGPPIPPGPPGPPTGPTPPSGGRSKTCIRYKYRTVSSWNFFIISSNMSKDS